MDKRGDIASLITWIPGFLIIFFLMLFFIATSASLAGKDFLSFSEENKIGAERISNNLETQNKLLKILSLRQGDETVRELIVHLAGTDDSSVKDNLKEKIKSAVEGELLGEDCYFFMVDDAGVYSSKICEKWEGLDFSPEFLGDDEDVSSSEIFILLGNEVKENNKIKTELYIE